eukprot:m.119958 g.119958  ORF g.119958 m.119958 type:complete len:68 (-) comp16487_c0_seq6:84-287(-)
MPIHAELRSHVVRCNHENVFSKADCWQQPQQSDGAHNTLHGAEAGTTESATEIAKAGTCGWFESGEN